MSMPYCPEAINALRHAAARNIRAAEIQASLGWDGAMLERVCRKHRIDIIGAIPPSPPIEPRIARVAIHDPLRAFAGKLSGRAGMMLVALTRHPIGKIVKAVDMGLGANNPTSARRSANKRLQEAGLPWVVEGVQGGADSGYRLVKTDGGDGWAP